jgi:succinate dehydrogenase / fumarate reductase cytochrome b subunit
MGWLLKSLNSSIGKKFVMALTGICLILFLIVHLIGNLTLYAGPDAFNGYVSTLDIVKPIIRVVEVILALIFIFHIFNGVRLWYENKKANPKNYAVNASSENSTFFSRTMIFSGSIIFIFLILHLSTFWYQFNFPGTHGEDVHEYYNIVVEWFQNTVYVIVYVAAMILLGFHLNHGFQSAFQTFGWNHNKYFPFIKMLGTLYAIVMAIGFASIPIYFYFFHGGN